MSMSDTNLNTTDVNNIDELKQLCISELFLKILVYRIEELESPIQLIIFKSIIENQDKDEYKSLFSSEEIDIFKMAIKESTHNNDMKTYISTNIKSENNYSEFSAITGYIYNNMTIFSDTIQIIFLTIQNYYGRGKIKLNQNDPEEFINNVVSQMGKRNFNPDEIRTQIKTLKIMDIIIQNITKIIEEQIIPVLPTKHKHLLKLQKYTMLNHIKKRASQSNFETKSLIELAMQYKKNNSELYLTIIDFINRLSTFNFNQLFNFLYRQKSSGITPAQFQKIYKLKEQQLNDCIFIDPYKFASSVIGLYSKVMESNSMQNISNSYYYNIALNTNIRSKEKQLTIKK